jgi:UDP-N-acetylmuramate dehydrogenase
MFDEFPKSVRRDVLLSQLTRLRLGGVSEFFAKPESESELVAILRSGQLEKVPVRVLGSGSNVLISASGLAGLTISLAAPAFCKISADSQRLTVGSGAKLGQIITEAVSHGLSGIESLIGIPGTVGGAVSGNAATNNDNIGQWVESVRVVEFNGNILTLSRQEISFGYRSSSLDGAAILSVTFFLEKDDSAELPRRMRKLWIVRKAKQPFGEDGVAVYAFKNPISGIPAGELIEQAGLKGTRIGGAIVYEQNANFIVADSSATADDILRLTRLVQEQVAESTDIELEPAFEIW